MRPKLAIAVAILVAGVTAGAIVVGPTFLDDNGDDDTTIESFPTETTTVGTAGTIEEGSGGGGSTDGTTASTSQPTTTATDPFAFDVVAVEECGSTCRDVTITLTNQQQSDAEGVVVYARIFAGQDTDGESIWEGTEQVGRMAAGESVSRTTRVSLSFLDGLAVQQADGWITIETTVQSERETMTFTEQRDVA